MKHKRLATILLVASALGTGFFSGHLYGGYIEYEKGVKERTQLENQLQEEIASKDLAISYLQSTVDENYLRIAELEKLRDIPSTYKMDTFNISAYSPYDNVSGIENDGTGDTTSTGTKPKDGTISVDPTVIPYGSKIVIIYDDGSMEYGIAEDCGGAIKGNKLDVFRWTYSQAVSFGRRNAVVLWYK